MSMIRSPSGKSIQLFKSSEQYLYAMKEDLSEWLRELLQVDVSTERLLEALHTGTLLCRLANTVAHAAATFLRQSPQRANSLKLPSTGVTYSPSAQPTTFLARDNVSNFIHWCRKEMSITDVLLFETEDLILRKNEKNVVLCLLEVARRASCFGVAAPMLIQLEQEMEEQISEEFDVPSQETPLPKPQRCMFDFRKLDEMVQHLVSCCTCPTLFSVVKVSEGKYRVGDSNTLIFVRILRKHVMVRIGGGWDTLEHYLDKHDPCRCSSLAHKQIKQPSSILKHEVRVKTENKGNIQTTVLVSRSQSPPHPVYCRSGRVSPNCSPSTRSSKEVRSTTPTREWEPPSSATGQCLHYKKKEDHVTRSTRIGRESTRRLPIARLSSSLPRIAQQSSESQAELSRPQTPLVVQRPAMSQPQHAQLVQPWTKSQFASKLRQNKAAISQVKENEHNALTPDAGRPGGPSTPIGCYIPIQTNQQIKIIQPCESGINLCNLDFDISTNGRPSHPIKQLNSVSGDTACLNTIDHSSSNLLEDSSHSKHRHIGPKEANMNCYLSPSSPEEETSLFRNLEDEILSNLQLVNGCSDSSEEGEDIWTTEKRPESTNVFLQSETQHAEEEFKDMSSTNKPYYDNVIDELMTGRQLLNKVNLENWVSTHYSRSKANNQTQRVELNTNNLESFRNHLGSSLSPMGSGADSKVPILTQGVQDDGDNKIPSATSSLNNKPQIPSFKLKKTLKRPEKVPSIYKLKLRPKIRPRCDHRPEMKASKIPTPLFYRRSHSRHAATTAELDSTELNRNSSENTISSQPNHVRVSGDEECYGALFEDHFFESWV